MDSYILAASALKVHSKGPQEAKDATGIPDSVALNNLGLISHIDDMHSFPGNETNSFSKAEVVRMVSRLT